MKKKIFVILIILILLISSYYIIPKIDKKGFYTLKKDNIKTITEVVGTRTLSNKEYKKEKNKIIKTYKYTNVEDPYTDLSLYITNLKNYSNFIVTKDFDLNKKEGSIQISRNSVKNKYIIIMDIKYNDNSYTIKITRGKGKIKLS